ncbi:MAG: dihydropyrimidinase [Chloroflexi bacterium]|nr:dihydropyrimidinase [Chloroflexota bacterium]
MSRQSACDLLVRGGTVVAADGTRATNVAVRDGLIVGIGGATLPAKRVIDATGLLVLPGVIDAHTHLNSEWPFPDERRPADDFASGTRGAAAGGITTVCDFVYALGDESLLQATNRVCAAAAAGAHVDVALHVAVTTFRETVLHELGDLVGAGFTSFKFYTSLPDFQARAADYLRVLGKLGSLGGVAMFHCEDAAIIEYQRHVLLKSHRTSPRFYAASKPAEAEVAATALALCMAAVAGVPAYLVHLSCGAALDQALLARSRGAGVFVETRPLYLHLTERAFDADDASAAGYIGTPPLRSEIDRQRLWRALTTGEIDVVASDHVGFTREQKYRPDDTFDTVPKGSASMETMLPMLYSEGVRTGRISLERCVELVATNPARIFGLYPRKGVIALGSDADLCILDPRQRQIVPGGALHSDADFDPFAGHEVIGWPRYTVSRGEVIFDDGSVQSRPGRGRLVPARDASVDMRLTRSADMDTEPIWTQPTTETLRAIAADRGLEIAPERLATALEMHAKFRPELDRLRAVRLDYVPTYIEPATALQWIQHGGRLP